MDVPPIVDLLFSAPYDLGPLTIRVLVASGGNGAVNDALTGPIPTSADYVEAGLVAPPPPDLTRAQARGRRAAGRQARVVRRVRAVPDARDAWFAGARPDRGRCRHGWPRGGPAPERNVLLSRRLQTRDTTAAAYVTAAVRSWEAKATGASVPRTGSLVTFTACDPGKRAVAPSNQRLDEAGLLLGGRSGVAVSAAESGVPAITARCVARLFAASPNARVAPPARQEPFGIAHPERAGARAAGGARVPGRPVRGFALTRYSHAGSGEAASPKRGRQWTSPVLARRKRRSSLSEARTTMDTEAGNVAAPATRRRRWSTTQTCKDSIPTT